MEILNNFLKIKFYTDKMILFYVDIKSFLASHSIFQHVCMLYFTGQQIISTLNITQILCSYLRSQALKKEKIAVLSKC